MRLDSDPPRLSSLGDPQLRTAFEQARADLPGPDALARLAARLPLGPGPGPGPSGAPPNGAAAGGGGAGAAGPASSALTLSSIAVGAGAGVVAAFLLWIAAPDALKPPERPDAPAPALVASAEPPPPSAPASEPSIRAPESAAPKEQAKAPAAPSAPAAARERKVIASPAKAVSTAFVAKGSSGSGAAPAGEDETEASLLTRAQAQMGSNPGGALSFADRHRALFPEGNMVQERELIAVSSLMALGRTAEARSRAEAFIAAHPQSAHRRRLSALVPGLAGGTEEESIADSKKSRPPPFIPGHAERISPMNWTAFPFSWGALAAALALIPGASFMTGCRQDTNLTGSSSSTAAAGVGGLCGVGDMGGVGGMGGSDDPCLFGACEGGMGGMGGSGGGMGGSGAGSVAAAVWSKHFGGGMGASIHATTANDSAGNLAITGVFKGEMDFGGDLLTSVLNLDIFLAKYDPDGNHVWSKRFGDGGYSINHAMAIDSAGNVAIAGTFDGAVDFGGGPLTPAGSQDIVVAKFDPNGNHVWSKRFGDAGNQSSNAVAFDSADNMVITGTFDGPADFGGGPLAPAGIGFMVKFDPNGNHVWSKRFGAGSPQFPYAMAIDSADNMVITGIFDGTVDFGGGPITASNADIFMAKFDPNGNHVWSERFEYVGYHLIVDMAIDSAGNVAIAGSIEGAVEFGGGPLLTAGTHDIFVARFDPNGNHVWSKLFGGAGQDIAAAIAIDSADNMVITGDLSGLIDFGGGPFKSPSNFVAKFDPNGNHLWSADLGEGGLYATGLTIDSADSVVIVGAGGDVFLTKLAP